MDKMDKWHKIIQTGGFSAGAIVGKSGSVITKSWMHCIRWTNFMDCCRFTGGMLRQSSRLHNWWSLFRWIYWTDFIPTSQILHVLQLWWDQPRHHVKTKRQHLDVQSRMARSYEEREVGTRQDRNGHHCGIQKKKNPVLNVYYTLTWEI